MKSMDRCNIDERIGATLFEFIIESMISDQGQTHLGRASSNCEQFTGDEQSVSNAESNEEIYSHIKWKWSFFLGIHPAIHSSDNQIFSMHSIGSGSKPKVVESLVRAQITVVAATLINSYIRVCGGCQYGTSCA